MNKDGKVLVDKNNINLKKILHTETKKMQIDLIETDEKVNLKKMTII